MKVVQLNCVYDKGSTGRIVAALHRCFLEQGMESFVIYGRGELCGEERVYKCAGEISSKVRNLLSRYTGNLYGGGKLATRRIIRLIQKISPDVVHVHCMNGYCADLYGLLNWLKDKGITTVITEHAEFYYTGNCGYAFECEQWKNDGCVNCTEYKCAMGTRNSKAPHRNFLRMKQAFDGFHGRLMMVGVSDWITRRSADSIILKGKQHTTVLNGLDTSVFTSLNDRCDVIDELHSKGKSVALFVTPYFEDENKGGRFILKLAEKLQNEPIHFVVAGLTEKKYSVSNITFLGNISDVNDLARFYSAADVTVLTSKRETFSMVTAESLCCGTPVVGFCAGAPEMITIQEYSQFVPYGDLEALADAVILWANRSLNKARISSVAASKYDYKVMAKNYLKIYEQLCEK